MYTFKVIPNPRTKSFAVFWNKEQFLADIKAGNFKVDVGIHSKTLLTTIIFAGGTCKKVNRQEEWFKMKHHQGYNMMHSSHTEEYLFKITKHQDYNVYLQYLTKVLDKLDVPHGTTVELYHSRGLQLLANCPQQELVTA